MDFTFFQGFGPSSVTSFSSLDLCRRVLPRIFFGIVSSQLNYLPSLGITKSAKYVTGICPSTTSPKITLVILWLGARNGVSRSANNPSDMVVSFHGFASAFGLVVAFKYFDWDRLIFESFLGLLKPGTASFDLTKFFNLFNIQAFVSILRMFNQTLTLVVQVVLTAVT